MRNIYNDLNWNFYSFCFKKQQQLKHALSPVRQKDSNMNMYHSYRTNIIPLTDVCLLLRGLAAHMYRLGYAFIKCTRTPRGKSKYNANRSNSPNNERAKTTGSIPNGPTTRLMIVFSIFPFKKRHSS